MISFVEERKCILEGNEMIDQLETLEIETGADPTWSVVWLHGLGADGHDFKPIVPEFDLPEAVRFIFPHAPIRPVTINGSYPMRAWYDIFSLERGGLEDEAGIRASASQVENLVQSEVDRGIPVSQLVLAGFSQGGAMALHVGLRYSQSIAGIIALSTYLPLPKTLTMEKTSGTKRLPIFMGHGTEDVTIPEFYGAQSRDQLQSEGYKVDWHTYPTGHSVCEEEILHINGWLRTCQGASY